MVIDLRGLAKALDRVINVYEGPVLTIQKACFTSASIPARFTVDKKELLKFDFYPNTDSHTEFVVQQEEMAFVVDGAANYGPIQGRTTEGVLEKELEVTSRKVKATARLIIRIAHKISMWSTEMVFQLQDEPAISSRLSA